MDKEQYFAADQVKVMASKSEQKIAADNGMWLTHPSHLNVNIKRLVAQCQPGENTLKS